MTVRGHDAETVARADEARSFDQGALGTFSGARPMPICEPYGLSLKAAEQIETNDEQSEASRQ